jgi:hypothetical protein
LKHALNLLGIQVVERMWFTYEPSFIISF